MKCIVLIVGVLALMAVAQAQNEENETTTVDPSEDEENSSSASPPPPPPPSHRPRPPGPGPKPPGPKPPGPHRPSGPGSKPPGPRHPRPSGNRFGPPQSHEENDLERVFRSLRGQLDELFRGQGFGNGFDFFQDQQENGPSRRRQGQQPQQQLGSGNQRPQRPVGNRFGPPQSNDGFDGYIQGPGFGAGFGFSEQQEQPGSGGNRNPFRRFPQRQRVLFDFGSGNDFGQGNSFGGQPQPESTTAAT